MDRLVLFVVVLSAVSGCQTPLTGFDPFAIGRQTRVPPPPTGVIGRQSELGRRAPVPPSLDSRTNSSMRANTYASEDRYWDSQAETPAKRELANQSTRPPQSDAVLTQSNSLNWSTASPLPSYSELSGKARPADAAYGPQLLPNTGPVSPIASAPVRVRGFQNSPGRQNLTLPPGLEEFPGDVRQASAISPRWEPRYDDLRR